MRILATLTVLLVGLSELTWSAEPSSSPLPAHVSAAFEKIEGTFTTSGNRNGQAFTGLYQTHWNDHRSGMVHLYHEGQERSNGISYWDPENQEIVETWAGKDFNVVHRFKIESETLWKGTAQLVRHDGESSTGALSVQFNDQGGFSFVAKAGNESLTTKNVRAPLSRSQESLKAFGEFMVGGTWVSEANGETAAHKYRWANDERSLILDRNGSTFPGASFVSLDQANQCIRWTEIDTDGVSGTAIMVPIEEKKWLYYGHYFGPDAVQRLSLKVEAIGPDELHSTGKVTIDGVEQDWAMTVWKRQRAK